MLEQTERKKLKHTLTKLQFIILKLGVLLILYSNIQNFEFSHFTEFIILKSATLFIFIDEVAVSLIPFLSLSSNNVTFNCISFLSNIKTRDK